MILILLGIIVVLAFANIAAPIMYGRKSLQQEDREQAERFHEQGINKARRAAKKAMQDKCTTTREKSPQNESNTPKTESRNRISKLTYKSTTIKSKPL